MLKVQTSRFGEIEVNEKDLIELPTGLVGFPDLKRYVLLDHDAESPFKWFQSVDDGSMAFVLINPLLFRPDYSVEVTDTEVSDLELSTEKDAVISVIVTMPGNPQNMTANLKAPLIFNLKNRKGKQMILTTSAYTTRHNITEELAKIAPTEDGQQLQETIDKAREESESLAGQGDVAEGGKS